MLLHLQGVLGGDQVAALRSRLEGADWVDGRETVGAQGARVKRNEQLADDSPLRLALGREVMEAMQRHPLYFAAALPARTLPPRFNRYAGGGAYGFHVDGAVMASPAQDGGTRHLRSDLSCTLFLGDPTDYEGGELVVHDTYGEHAVKLEAGDAILYPASSLHRVAPVTSGVRLAAFFWIQSLVRDDARRQMLFELDATIQALDAGGADQESLLRLTGIYHNLLRAWAEP